MKVNYKILKMFEREYRDHTPIWWYTYESLLYPMVTRALRMMHVDRNRQNGILHP